MTAALLRGGNHLEVLGVGDDLNNAVPDLVGDVVASQADEFENWTIQQ